MGSHEKEIKKRLIDLEISQAEAIKHFGWSRQYWYDLIRGRTRGPATSTNLQKVYEFLGMDVKEHA